ncbi:MAG TPA: adenosylmethionine decarboxylase [Azospirillaceae bacterium]|nr:adenosylmethionine decarboxylase [Azospirillaceae bacterium]
MAKAASLFQLGMDLGCEPRKAQAEVIKPETATKACQAPANGEERKDYFISRNGKVFAGTHLIIDLWGAECLDDLGHVEKTLVEAIEEAGATLLHIHLHHFTPNGGISGVAVLAESHVSIHTWPEKGYAALDVFMCGLAQPMKAVPVLKRAFKPSKTDVGEILRGEVT